VGKTLLDLGVSINLMPLSLLAKIGHLDLKPTRITLQLAYCSIKRPHGVLEDVLVKVDKFIFPADFVVMDIEEDFELPLILGRTFMNMAKILVNVHDGQIKLQVNDEDITFNVLESMNHPKDEKSCL